MTSGRALLRVPVLREPVAAALSRDERWLAVANLLPEGAANRPTVAAAVTVLDTETDEVRAHLRLPNGSTAVRGIAFSPVGEECAVLHNVARFQVPTTQAEHGWMNASALSLLGVRSGTLRAAVLLDEPRRGAANPWATAWSPCGRWLCVAHAGTHELSVIDAEGLAQRLAVQPEGRLIPDLDFLRGIRKRIALGGNGPRALAVAGSKAYVAGFFTDTVSVVDLDQDAAVEDWSVGDGGQPSLERVGERLFHDATISRQGWQSCASCHPDGRADALNWDLLNDGIGNPKNTKSLLLSHQTAPAMSLGVRDSAEAAVRAGLRHILFALRSEADACAIDTYLASLRPVLSPFRLDVEMNAAAQRGRRVFEDAQVGCARCHPQPWFTDREAHAVGTGGRLRSRAEEAFDTPTLVECWRTAPYLHDGSAANLHEVLTTRNPADRHGKTSHLTSEQIHALVAYLLCL